MKRVKKLTAVFMATLMILFSSVGMLQAFAEDILSTGVDNSEIGITSYEKYGMSRFIAGTKENYDNNSANFIDDDELPSKYNLMDYDLITEPEYQGFGDCWAFATMGSLESNALVQGYGEQHFSKSHLTNYAYNPKNEGYSADDVWNNGGSAFYSILTLSNFEGIASEKDFPNNYDTTDIKYGEKDRYNHGSGFILDDAVYITSAAKAKEYIKNNGAMYIDYYSVPLNDCTYSEKYHADMIYYPGPASTNHAVTLIGWDDTIPASAFKNHGNTPSCNGGWIIKNSWTDSKDESYIMYISYDQYIPYFVGFSVKEDTNYLNDYTYSERGGENALYDEYLVYGDIYVAKSDERISEACIFLETAGEITKVTATVNVYTNLPKGDCLPTSGTLAETHTVKLYHDGYYSIELPEEISVSKGEKYAVTVTLRDSNNCTIYVLVEQNSRKLLGGYEKTYTGAEGQSFVSMGSNNDFEDVYSTYSSYGVTGLFFHVNTKCNHTLSKSGSGYKCTQCSKKIDSICDEHDKTYTSVIKEPTFTSKGEEGIFCCDCGEKISVNTIDAIPVPTIKIDKNPGTKAVNYGSYLKLSANVSNLSKGYFVRWRIEGKDEELYSQDCVVTCKTTETVIVEIVDEDGNVVKDKNGNPIMDKEKITVKSNLYLRIIAFFRALLKVKNVITN